MASDISPVVSRLEQLCDELGRAESWNPSELERELGSFSGNLAEILKEDLDAGILENLEKEIKSSLKLYKKRVSSDIYRQLFDKQFKQRILDLFGLPEFSLMKFITSAKNQSFPYLCFTILAASGCPCLAAFRIKAQPSLVLPIWL